jgi:hypothetical protein
LAQFHKYGINLRKIDNSHVSISFDEITSLYNLDELIEIFYSLKKNKMLKGENNVAFEEYHDRIYQQVPKDVRRVTKFM